MSYTERPVVFSVGSGVRIEVWGGYNTIGGSCVIVRDRDEAVMLDQGLCFSALRRFYGGPIQPGVVEDLREVGALPPRRAYEGVSEIYISHLHLDHLGSLAIPFEYDVRVYVPSRRVLEKLARFWAGSWKELLLPSGVDLADVEEVSGSRRVRAVRVSHSAYPSYAYVVETSEGSILYTGDFRIGSPLGLNTLASLSSVGSVDVAIIEGTNFLRRVTPLEPSDAIAILERVLGRYRRRYVFIAVHPLDVESFLLVARALRKHGFVPVLTHTKYAELLDTQLRLLELEEGYRFFLLPLRGGQPPSLNFIETIERREVGSLERVAFFTSMTAVDELKMLVRLYSIDTAGLIQITLASEPPSEEGWLVERRLLNWLKRLGVNSFRIHLSGHYYPHEYREIIEAIKPKKVIPIHTSSPETMVKLFERYRHSTPRTSATHSKPL